MKERPILFSGPMVRAILDGRKTQTRRVVKPHCQAASCVCIDDVVAEAKCPYGQPGERLWVRETFAPFDGGGVKRTIYRADANGGTREIDKVKAWKPSIFMTRDRSRLTLEIVSVRAERLNEISDADVLAEGCQLCDERHAEGHESVSRWWHYRELWNAINGPGAWEKNQFCWVIEFRRLPV
jgi:hypothetical protein